MPRSAAALEFPTSIGPAWGLQPDFLYLEKTLAEQWAVTCVVKVFKTMDNVFLCFIIEIKSNYSFSEAPRNAPELEINPPNVKCKGSGCFPPGKRAGNEIKQLEGRNEKLVKRSRNY
ncbi:hypothetical protein EVAR_39947_1 [Eumeta japonica]|uniref:Uncharacterized protein n=1 Tax=Eumeta variegata TaxID=151549 RepID=A0A4C1X0M5_EUMVA|nr:hypothetical protein EVAR_39947_1 [Eumeta japonica]